MTILTEEMRQRALEVEGNAYIIEIENGTIKRFVEAVGDKNQLWQDDQKAQQGPFRGIVAPPGLLHTVLLVGPWPELPFELSVERKLDGGGEWEYFNVVRPGDILTSITKVSDIYEREGRSGPMVFIIYETIWTNQKGEIVARSSATVILR